MHLPFHYYPRCYVSCVHSSSSFLLYEFPESNCKFVCTNETHSFSEVQRQRVSLAFPVFTSTPLFLEIKYELLTFALVCITVLMNTLMICCRYASWKNLLAIELLNEPLAPKVTLDTLKKYYTAGYTAVKEKVQRSDVYVIMSNRLNTQDPTELVEFTSTFDNCVIDVHYYNLYNLNFPSVKENIDFVKTNRSSQFNSLMRANG